MLPIAILIPKNYWTRKLTQGNAPGHRSLPDILAALKQAGAQGHILEPDTAARPHDFAGLVLPGGSDIHPQFYGQEVKAAEGLDPAYDQFEINWAQEAFLRNLPLLGICRGMQLMNVAAGGTLAQDVPDHNPPVPRAQAVHPVHLHPSVLSDILEAQTIDVNSIHHQAVARLGKGLRPVAWAPDGVVEAIERTEVQRGVQFHPEDMRSERPFQRLFDRLVADAAKF